MTAATWRRRGLDVVLNRTLVFGALAAFIAAVYVAVVVGIGWLVGTRGRPSIGLSIAATAMVAVAFQPVRSRVQRWANRLVYGERATPYEILSRFSERVAGTYATEGVLARMAVILAEGTGSSRAEVWLRVGNELRLSARWPDAGGFGVLAIPFADGQTPTLPSGGRVVPVHHHGEQLGALVVAKPADQEFNPTQERLLTDLASQAGLVLRNVRLTAELQARVDQISRQAQDMRASRQRIVAAQDAERRRLERDIHDGAQQHLVALAVRLRMVIAMAVREPQQAKMMLRELTGQTNEALETLRDLARGIYPSVLADHGLIAALTAQARKLPMTVDVDADRLRRHSPELEAAVYFTVLEALQNVAKYARATRTVVRLEETDDTLSFSVADDGAGFDVASGRRGSGLQNMADRVEALGGMLRIASVSGEGTTVTGRIPTGAGGQTDHSGAGSAGSESGQEPDEAAVQASASRSGPKADLGM